MRFTDNSAFLPHIVASSERRGTLNDLLECFTSVNSIQSLAWHEGCVWDGLGQLYAALEN